jgi:thioredoxin 1
MSELINLNKESFEKAVTEDKTVLVDFWAPWCGPCKAIAPILGEIAAELGDAVSIYKVNVDDNTELAQEHGVNSIPTILVYKGGSLSETLVGVKSKEDLISIIQS